MVENESTLVGGIINTVMDKLTKEQRHHCMASIRSKDTKPEMLVRRYLFSRGYRYRLNHPRLPGHPDVVLRKFRTVIFVNGCFWHGHENCGYFRLPKTNTAFWESKIMRNRERDVQEQRTLAEMGWHCITIWECQLRPAFRDDTLASLEFTLNKIFLGDNRIDNAASEDDYMPMAAEHQEHYGKKKKK